MSTKPRKGARTVSAVPKDILAKLNQGSLESATLVECLAMDLHALATTVGIRAPQCADSGIVKRMQHYGAHIPSWQKFADHESDTVRGFAAFALARDSSLSLAAKFKAIKSLADDTHFGVREWAWLALRPDVAADLPGAIKILARWVDSPSPNIRRFASEITRPRGVWCEHIDSLKEDPKQGLPILEPLATDTTKYVQDSVANWLNDASKTQPAWVKTICKNWAKRDGDTRYLIKRAMRSIEKKSGK